MQITRNFASLLIVSAALGTFAGCGGGGTQAHRPRQRPLRPRSPVNLQVPSLLKETRRNLAWPLLDLCHLRISGGETTWPLQERCLLFT